MAKDNWKNKVKKFFKGAASATRKFMAWFKKNIEPGLVEFLEANKDVAMRIVIQVAKDFASASNADKRRMAFNMIDDHIGKELPNFNTPEHWIGLLIEIAVAVLKASGKL